MTDITFGTKSLKKFAYNNPVVDYGDEYGGFQYNQMTGNNLLLMNFHIKQRHRGKGLSHLMLKRALNHEQAHGCLIHLIAGQYVPDGETRTSSMPFRSQLEKFYTGYGFVTHRYIPDWGYYMVNENAE